jgi:GntR family transcriptional regulator/MocR family aminotransferase
MENPSHFLLHAVVRRAGLTPVGVPVDRSGVVVDRLARSRLPAVLVSPAHQFPMGVSLSPDRRVGLAMWARESGGLIIEDDYDAELRYDRAPIGALQGLSPEQIVYIGSASKSLSPSVRIGWMVLPQDLVEPIRQELFTSVLQLSAIDQLALAVFLACGGFDRHMRRMRGVYRRRRDVLVAALERELPGLGVSGIAAGLHVVLELDSALAESSATTEALALGIAVDSISEHALSPYDGARGLLLGFGAVPEPTIPEAVRLLAAAIRRSANGATWRATAARGV